MVDATDKRFTRPLYTVAQVGRLIGCGAYSSRMWAHTKTSDEQTDVETLPLVTTVEKSEGSYRTVPFIGLVEASVVYTLRRQSCSTHDLRTKLAPLLRERLDTEHPFASRSFIEHGPTVFHDHGVLKQGKNITASLTVEKDGRRVFRDDIMYDLSSLFFHDGSYASSLILNITKRPVLRATYNIQNGDPIFINGGAPLSAVQSRLIAGEPLESVSADYMVPVEDITEAIKSIWKSENILDRWSHLAVGLKKIS